MCVTVPFISPRCTDGQYSEFPFLCVFKCLAFYFHILFSKTSINTKKFQFGLLDEKSSSRPTIKTCICFIFMQCIKTWECKTLTYQLYCSETQEKLVRLLEITFYFTWTTIAVFLIWFSSFFDCNVYTIQIIINFIRTPPSPSNLRCCARQLYLQRLS